MKQPHEHIAAAYQGRTGSPYQADTEFKKPRRIGLLIVQLIPVAVVGLCFVAWAVS